ncbi:MAG: glycosyltransferase family 39 protein, partial [Bryobacteraceae bacterium]
MAPVGAADQCPAGGHLYTYFPPGTTLLAAPFVWMIDAAARRAGPWSAPIAARMTPSPVRALLEGDLAEAHAFVEILIASFWLALAAVVMYLIGRQFVGVGSSAALSAIFAFCTLAWSTASRALWQHGPAMLLIAASLLLLIRASRRPSWIPIVGALLALAVQVRPPMVIVAVAVTVYVWRHHRAKLVFYLLWASTVCFVFALFNYWIYGSPLPPYITGETTKFAVHSGFFEALAGSLVSPARGLLVFSPVFALSLYGLFAFPTGETTRRLRPYLVSILVCYWIMIALYPIWWGGHSIGARYFSDL